MKIAFASVAVGLAMTACGSNPVMKTAHIVDSDGNAILVNNEKVVGALVLDGQGATNPNVVNVASRPVVVSKLTTDFNGIPVTAPSDIQQYSGAILSFGMGSGAAMSGYGNLRIGEKWAPEQTTISNSAEGGAGGAGGTGGSATGGAASSEAAATNSTKVSNENNIRNNNHIRVVEPQRHHPCGNGREGCSINVKLNTKYVPC